MSKVEIYCPECRQTYTIKSPIRTNEHIKVQPGKQPEDGDWTVCEKCTAILVRKGGAFRAPTDEEWLAANIDEQKLLKKAQDYFKRKIKGEAMTEEEASAAFAQLIEKVPDELRSRMPYMLARRMMTGEEADVNKLIIGGLAGAIKMLLERPYSSIVNDIKGMTPCIMAMCLIEQGGDIKAAIAQLDGLIAKDLPPGFDIDLLRKEGLVP